MKKSYEKWKIGKAIIACLLLLGYFDITVTHIIVPQIGFHIAELFGYGGGFVFFCEYSVFAFFLLLTLRAIEFAFYPQWRTLLWNNILTTIVWSLLIVGQNLLMKDTIFKAFYIIIWGILVLPWILKAIKDVYYAKKYHLDEYDSLKDLVASQPEARKSLSIFSKGFC